MTQCEALCLLAGASGSTGETGASGQAGLTGGFRLFPFHSDVCRHGIAIRGEEGCDTM